MEGGSIRHQSSNALNNLYEYIMQLNSTGGRQILVEPPTNPVQSFPNLVGIKVRRTDNCIYDKIMITSFKYYGHTAAFPDRNYVVQYDLYGHGTASSSSQHFDAKFFDTKEQVVSFLISILFPEAPP
jgi:hypothetical protein